jgi:hypothetical protein
MDRDIRLETRCRMAFHACTFLALTVLTGCQYEAEAACTPSISEADKTVAFEIISAAHRRTFGDSYESSFDMTFELTASRTCGDRVTLRFDPKAGVLGAAAEYEVELSKKTILAVRREGDILVSTGKEDKLTLPSP